MRTLIWLIAVAITAHASPSRFKVTETFEIAKVSADFRVGFSLLTTPDHQYVAYYDADRNMTVASRALDSSKWIYQILPSKIAWDSHNYVTMALDEAGHLHISGNMHCDPLVYFRSEKPGDITSFKREKMTGDLEDRVTYPKFLTDSESRLVFTYRHGSSGNGINLYNCYDPATRTWKRLFDTPLFDGEGLRNAYPAGPTRGPDGAFHVHWVWRHTPDCASNHHLSYARSRDLIHWESAFGKKIDLPIRFDQSGLIVDPIPGGGGIINGGHLMAFDAENKPILAYHKSDAAGNMQIYAARPQDGAWKLQSLTKWRKPVYFSGGGSMSFIGITLEGLAEVAPHQLALSYQHKDYGSGVLRFDTRTLELVDSPIGVAPKFPSELQKLEGDFPGLAIRRAVDLAGCGNEGTRYMLQWETLDPNRDRPREPPLPAPSSLRLYKLTGISARP